MKPLPLSRWAILIGLASSFAATFTPNLTGEATPFAVVAEAQPQTRSTTTLNPEVSAAIVTLQGVGGKGTGSIIKANGIVLTSEHVIRNAQQGQVSILTHSGVSYPGKVIAVDEAQDLALIQILSKQTFSSLPLADASSLERGETVYALDDPFASLENFTRGKLQKIEGAARLYTDILLSPGDSGGPLLNAQGEIIGINRAIVQFPNSNETATFGLATHISSIREFLDNPSREQFPVAATAPVSNVNLGITVKPETLEIIEIESNSLAEQWSLKLGDQIVGYNYRRIDDLAPLQEFLATNPSEVLLFLRRNGYLVRLRLKP